LSFRNVARKGIWIEISLNGGHSEGPRSGYNIIL
jgi:hypothetical protein